MPAQTSEALHRRVPERQCDQHTIVATVRYTCTGRNRKEIDTVAALLRALAVEVDGFCAIKGADDNDFEPPASGLKFHFRTAGAKKTFLEAIPYFLSQANVVACLRVA